MTREEFVPILELELRLRGVGFSRADVLEFVASVWTLAEDNPDPAYWAQEFMDSGRANVIV